MLHQNLVVEINAITGEIVRSAMTAHTALGPGLLESIYRKCLCHELVKRGLHVVLEKPVHILYDGIDMGIGLRLDLLVESLVIVEVKSVRKLLEVDQSQLLSYLQLTEIKTGLLINFNVRHLRHGIQRMVR